LLRNNGSFVAGLLHFVVALNSLGHFNRQAVLEEQKMANQSIEEALVETLQLEFRWFKEKPEKMGDSPIRRLPGVLVWPMMIGVLALTVWVCGQADTSLRPWLVLMVIGGWIVSATLAWWVVARGLTGSNARLLHLGRSPAQRATDSLSRKTFDDVVGLHDAKRELRTLVDFLKNAEKYTRLGAKVPRGVLLFGPPGCGKTLLARAFAGEADIPFFYTSGSEFVQFLPGVGAARVRTLFDQLKAKRPSLAFIDHLESLCLRAPAGSLDFEREQTLCQLLVEMDGFAENPGIIIQAATSRPGLLDERLLRAGRFDCLISVPLPNEAERQDLVRQYLYSKPCDEDLVRENAMVEITRQTDGMSGSDLAGISNEAALQAATRDREKIGLAEVLEAIAEMKAKRVQSGPADHQSKAAKDLCGFTQDLS
jgi:ATP-dependent Zn protease